MNTAQEQSQELASKLWSIANDLRGNMDASKFKNYILGVIFYRYLSERTEKFMDGLLKKDGTTYREAMTNEELVPTIKVWSIDCLGYIIEPKYFFSTMIEEILDGTFSIQTFEKAIRSLTDSTIGQKSEPAFDKLFDDMNLQDKDLGKEVSDRTRLMSKVMLKINDISFDTENSKIDILGTAYMILIGLFASDAGKKAGEYWSPSFLTELCAKLATVGLDSVKSVCDPCGGSGQMCLSVKNVLPSHNVFRYYADELNGSTYNLMRMNFLMHGIPYNKFITYNEDILTKDKFYENGQPIYFTVQCSNPPYSTQNTQTSASLDDPRYASCGVLAPKKMADLAFVQHMVYHMDPDDGRIAVLLPHGVLFRGGNEKLIRKNFIDSQNVLDAVIGLPKNMFQSAAIPVCCLVFKKKRNGDSDNIYFVDASKYFKKGKNTNELTEEDITRIVEAYKKREYIDKFAAKVPLDVIRTNDYNLNISRYIDSSEEEEEIILDDVSDSIKTTDAKIKESEANLKSYFKELGLIFPFGD